MIIKMNKFIEIYTAIDSTIIQKNLDVSQINLIGLDNGGDYDSSQGATIN